LTTGVVRALLPDALLRDPWTLQERVGLLCDAEGSLVEILPVEDIPGTLELEHFAGETWTAAPILAHAHLESFDAPSADWDRSGFVPWVEDLLAWRELPDRLDAPISAALSLAELQRFGCGLVLSHVAEAGAEGAAFPGLPEVLPLPEVFAPGGSALPSAYAEHLARSGSLSLHAPYSVSPDVARHAFSLTGAQGILSLHLGEFAEERQFLAHGTGPMADLFSRRGRELGAGRWPSPVDWLQDVGGLQAGTLAVHGGDLDVEELRRLHAAGVGLVFCPGTHVYFDRPSTRFLEAGLPLPALGCDSRASNARLDPLREVHLALQMMPEPGPQAWWQALTQRGAEVLRRDDLGSLHVGKRLRCLRIQEVPSAALSNAAELCAFLCSGEELRVQVSDW
jgi:cytosine/adenosine deaminase-related metal-dependent hydrolase